MITLKYVVEDAADPRSEAIRAVKTLAAAYNLEVDFPPPTAPPTPPPGDLPG